MRFYGGKCFWLGSKLNFKLGGEDDVSIIKCLVVQL